jgi:uncharacterized integral membrane protein
MKKLSILVFLVGVAITIFLVIYYRSVVNPVDAETMDINPAGNMIAEWPLFIGILTTFVGGVFYYVSHYGKRIS